MEYLIPRGINVFLLCGDSEIIYDLLLYQGSTTEINSICHKKFGLRASTVIHLTKTVEKNKHFIYFDNFL